MNPDTKSWAVWMIAIFGSAAVVVIISANTPKARALREKRQAEAERANRHRETMDTWYKAHPEAEASKIVAALNSEAAGESGIYLDGRTGAELERTVRRVIEAGGYSCDKIRWTAKTGPHGTAEASVLVDCGDDGEYYVVEYPDGFAAVKR